MIAAALLLSAAVPVSPGCAIDAIPRASAAATHGVRHVFQNGEAVPLRLGWIDPGGRKVDLGEIAPGAIRPIQTFVGHVFTLTDPAGRCRRVVRVEAATAGTLVGNSRYRPAAIRPGWRVFVDAALDPAADPARAALATVAVMLREVDSALPEPAVRALRETPIFLLRGMGDNAMYHRDPEWLIAHGRTVEMLDGIEISDAATFNRTARIQPGTILHELSHGYYGRLSDAERAGIEAVYRRALASGRYDRVRRPDGSIGRAYAMDNAAEYFAELTEAYFSRNDFGPVTRAELIALDPEGARMIAAVWRVPVSGAS